MLAMEMGTGKDLCNLTPIPAPEGFVQMGDLQPGDRVFDEKGEVRRVTRVYPQGKRPVYQVRMNDGCTLIAGADHLWITLDDSLENSLDKNMETGGDWAASRSPVTTIQIQESLAAAATANSPHPERRHAIPMAQPLRMPETALAGVSAGRTTEADAAPHQAGDRRYITSVTPMGVRETTCITVDSPSGLFLAGPGMVPTHNTRVAIDLMEDTNSRNTLVLCPLSVADHVWEDQILTHGRRRYRVVALGSSAGAVAKKAEKFRKELEKATILQEPMVVVVNYESAWREPLAKTLKSITWNLLILDECHPAGTPIETPGGPRNIEELRDGDSVWGVDHLTGEIQETQVTHTFRRENHEELVRIGETLMTPEHPVWTARGYIPARDITPGDQLCRLEEEGNTHAHPDLRMVPIPILGIKENEKILRETVRWEGPQTNKAEQAKTGEEENLPPHLREMPGTLHGGKARTAVLQQKLRHEDQNGNPDSASPEQGNNAGHEIQTGSAGKTPQAPGIRIEPTEGPGKPGEVSRSQQGTGLCTPDRRQRNRPDGASENPGIMAGMADGIHSFHRQENAGTADKLQNRHSGPASENRYRSGRALTQDQENKGSRPEEGSLPGENRVGDPEIQERAGDGEPRGSEVPDHVFNIETGTGNYFAAGLLVHNSHRLKTPKSKASLFASQVANKSRRRLALTGTPMPHSPLDIYAQYRAIDSGVFGYDSRRFRDRYTVSEEINVRKKGVTQVRSKDDLTQIARTIGYKNEDELQQKFHSIAFVVAANEVLDLPETTSNYLRVHLSTRAARIHDELDREFRADVEAGKITNATNALTRLLRLQQITSGFAVTENQSTGNEETVEVDQAKADALKDILEDLSPDENVVVFVRFLHDLDVVHRVAQGAGRDSWELSGRRRQLVDWQRAGGVLAAQIQAGSMGIDMTAARYCIYYSLGYSLGDYLQSRARVHRPGQTRDVRYIHLIAAGTVDETVMGSLRNKENVIERIMRAMGPAAQHIAE